MSRTFTQITVAVAASTLLAVLAIGCGGSKSQSVETYMKNAERLDQQHEAVANPLRGDLDTMTADLTDEDAVPPAVASTFGKLFDQEDEFAVAIEKLKPPKEARDIQTEAVSALRAEAAFGRNIVAKVTPTTTLGDVTAMIESDEGATVQERRHNACVALQKLADDRNIKVDMTC